MYIISNKKKDYYDGVVGTMGIDKKIVYDRKISILKDEKDFPKEFQRKKSWGRNTDNYFLNLQYYPIKTNSKYIGGSPFIIGFCGKLYTGWKLYRENDKNPRFFGELDDFITDMTYDEEVIKKHVKSNGWNTNLFDDIAMIKSYKPIEIFRSLNSPVFIYDSDYYKRDKKTHSVQGYSAFIINPILSDYEFYTVFDTFRAFQEIQMFLGGVLGTNEKQIVEVADKYKITQHGFDKWSFRKEPKTN